MGGDLSRSTFNPAKRYTGVRQQQGRVNLDADWNEQAEIAAYRVGLETADTFGRAAAPRDAAGFGLALMPGDLVLEPGRIYVAGRLCELASTPVPILNFVGDGNATAGTQVQLASLALDGVALQQGAWVQISAQGSPAPAPLLAQVTAVNAASGSVTFSTSVAAFEPPATSPQIQRVTTYLTQPDYPLPPALPSKGSAVVFLDVWERTVTALEDPCIQEVALGGPDTATRTKDVWQVKVLPLPAGFSASCSMPDADLPGWQAATQPSAGLLSNGVLPPTGGGACSLNSGSGYSGMENQFYRVEIHQPGTPSTSTAGPIAYPLPPGTATFKWSRDNASVATGVTGLLSTPNSAGVSTSQLSVLTTGRDAVLSFSPGDWVEVTDDVNELSGLPGELRQIDANGVDQTRATVTLTTPLSAALSGRITGGGNYHTRVTRWDHGGPVLIAGTNTVWVDLNSTGSTGDIPVPPPGTTLVLEDGITVSFNLSSSTGLFLTADAWSFAARTANGSIESLAQAPPSSIRHHYARLAVVNFDQSFIADCRQLFAPLSDPALHVTAVTAIQSGAPLLNDSTITVQQLKSGLIVSCDGPIDPASLLPATTTPATAQLANCSVSVGLPVVASASILGFQPLTLRASVSLDVTGTAIQWVPSPSVTDNLSTQLTAIATQLTPAGTPVVVPTLLAHLTLKGNSIWSAYNQNVYLDGECLTAPYLDAAGVQHTGLVLPSGDGRRGGDFSTWFWLTSPPTPPALTANATSLPFPATPVNGRSAPQTFTLTNSSANPVSFTLVIAGSNPGDFTASSSTGLTLQPNSSSTISVTFTPTQANSTRTATLTITSAVPSPPPPITLSGVSVGYQVNRSPDTVPFGTVQVGQSSQPPLPTITLQNTGAPVVITGVSTASTNFVITNACGSLATGQSCTISVQFTPKNSGAISDLLTITTNPAGLISPVSLTGTGSNPKNQSKDTADSKTIRDNKDQKDTKTQIDNKPKGYKEQIVRVLDFANQIAGPDAAVEDATGKAFIQPEERPEVGQQALTEPKEPS